MPDVGAVGWRRPARLGAPPADRLVADGDTAFEHEFLDLAEAERESEVESDAVFDDLGRVAVASVRRHFVAHLIHSLSCSELNNVTVPSLSSRCSITASEGNVGTVVGDAQSWWVFGHRGVLSRSREAGESESRILTCADGRSANGEIR